MRTYPKFVVRNTHSSKQSSISSKRIRIYFFKIQNSRNGIQSVPPRKYWYRDPKVNKHHYFWYTDPNFGIRIKYKYTDRVLVYRSRMGWQHWYTDPNYANVAHSLAHQLQFFLISFLCPIIKLKTY